MSIIVETGSLVSDANSYVDVDYCDTFCENMGLTEWAGGSDDEKEAAILRAMAYVEDKPFGGCKASSDSALRWPRSGLADRDGNWIDSDVIPDGLQKAVAMAAYEELVSPRCLMPNLAREDFIVYETIGPMSTTYERFKTKPVFPMIDAYLKGLLDNDSCSLVRG